MKFLELRKRAETELGDRFNIKEFHEVMIGNGAMPLEVLDGQLTRYLETKKR
jgi:uncharacterized protein (DUF885 family)